MIDELSNWHHLKMTDTVFFKYSRYVSVLILEILFCQNEIFEKPRRL